MIPEHDPVVLACDLPDYGLKAGDLGTVVSVYGDDGYEVEFMTLVGETVAVVTLDKTQVRPAGRHEMHHSRLMQSQA